MVLVLGGKVTPVRYKCGLKDTSGQEEKCAHISAHFLIADDFSIYPQNLPQPLHLLHRVFQRLVDNPAPV
jgi:hypothetical protein